MTPKKTIKLRSILILVFATVTLFVVSVAATWRPNSVSQEKTQQGPNSKEPAGPRPSRILAARPRTQPPALAGAGDQARKATLAFIDWAGASTLDEREVARKAIAGARENKDVAVVLCEEAFKAQKADHSRALLVLSILGELRNPAGEECLHRFLKIPFPTQGTMTKEGEIAEQTALGELQAQAIDGLAYIRTKTGDEEVLRQVKEHPSIIVRAEAIDAYLWNHQNSQEARNTLKQYVRKGEEIYLDRIRREDGERGESFNRKLEAYLKAHPEVIPPPAEKGGKNKDKRQEPAARDIAPPQF